MEGLFILFAYTVVILFLTIDDRASGSRQYNTGGGKLSPLSGSLSIAAAWIWAPAFFVSSERGYLYGWQGLAWFMALFLVMILSGLLSTVDCNLCSVASMASDFRGDLKTAKVSMLVLLALGIAVANIPGITVTGLFLFYGTLRASTLFVTLLTLSVKRLAARGVFYGVVLSVIVGLPVFAFGSVADIPEMKVIGSILAVGISGTFALIYTGRMKKNEDYQSKH